MRGTVAEDEVREIMGEQITEIRVNFDSYSGDMRSPVVQDLGFYKKKYFKKYWSGPVIRLCH